MDLSKIRSVYICGFLGGGTVGLAEYFLRQGKKVYGSEYSPDKINPLSRSFKERGMVQFWVQQPTNVPRDLDLFIANEAILPGTDGHTELQAAQEQGIPVRRIRQTWADIARGMKSIVVAGTHGKSTTVGMITKIMLDAGLDPTVQIGAPVPEFNNRYYYFGKSEWIILEGCENRRQFLYLEPCYSVLTNIGLDHLDIYEDQDDYNQAFAEFIKRTKTAVILDRQATNENDILRQSSTDIAILGIEKALAKVEKYHLAVPGKHNLQNAARAYTLAQAIGIDDSQIQRSLENFQGLGRRFDFQGKTKSQDVPVYEDYAHNPDKVAALLQGAREVYPQRRIVIIFQPHQYHRTAMLLKQFGKSFNQADRVIIYSIYQPTRDGNKAVDLVDEERLQQEILANEPSKDVALAFNPKQLVQTVREKLDRQSVLLIAGAGDINKYTPQLLDL